MVVVTGCASLLCRVAPFSLRVSHFPFVCALPPPSLLPHPSGGGNGSFSPSLSVATALSLLGGNITAVVASVGIGVNCGTSFGVAVAAGGSLTVVSLLPSGSVAAVTPMSLVSSVAAVAVGSLDNRTGSADIVACTSTGTLVLVRRWTG